MVGAKALPMYSKGGSAGAGTGLSGSTEVNTQELVFLQLLGLRVNSGRANLSLCCSSFLGRAFVLLCSSNTVYLFCLEIGSPIR